jgi:riboflavin kinase / FMN adenylyltransferase
MIRGKIIQGDKIGRTFGYRTANLDTPKNKVKLTSGVFASYVFLDNKKYQGALAFQKKPWKLEVHILDFKSDDFYGKHIEVEPVQKVSEMCRFSSENELKEKIENDINMVREIFN